MMLMQVSIAEGPVTVVVKREAMSPAGEGRRDSSNRASIIQVRWSFSKVLAKVRGLERCQVQTKNYCRHWDKH